MAEFNHQGQGPAAQPERPKAISKRELSSRFLTTTSNGHRHRHESSSYGLERRGSSS
jgi:hypothetical protein